MLQQTPSEEECGDKNTPEESIVAARRVSGHSKGATAGDRGSTGNQVPQKSDQSHTKNPDTSAIVNQNRLVQKLSDGFYYAKKCGKKCKNSLSFCCFK